jgi:hypothetical protein
MVAEITRPTPGIDNKRDTSVVAGELVPPWSGWGHHVQERLDAIGEVFSLLVKQPQERYQQEHVLAHGIFHTRRHRERRTAQDFSNLIGIPAVDPVPGKQVSQSRCG